MTETFNGMYRAKVVNSNDPKSLGRVQVRPMGLVDDSIPDNRMPWAEPAVGIFSSEAVYTIPKPGVLLWIFFDGGDWTRPIYFAVCPGGGDWKSAAKIAADKIKALSNKEISIKPEDLTILHDSSQLIVAIQHLEGRKQLYIINGSTLYCMDENNNMLNIIGGDVDLQVTGDVRITGEKIFLN